MVTTVNGPAAMPISDLFVLGNNDSNETNIMKHLRLVAFRWKNVRLFLDDRYLDPDDRNPKGKNYYALTDALIESLSNPKQKVEKKFTYEGERRLLESLLISLAKMFEFLALCVEIERERDEVLVLRIVAPQTETVAA